MQARERLEDVEGPRRLPRPLAPVDGPGLRSLGLDGAQKDGDRPDAPGGRRRHALLAEVAGHVKTDEVAEETECTEGVGVRPPPPVVPIGPARLPVLSL